jgi:hypothetical protein
LFLKEWLEVPLPAPNRSSSTVSVESGHPNGAKIQPFCKGNDDGSRRPRRQRRGSAGQLRRTHSRLDPDGNIGLGLEGGAGEAQLVDLLQHQAQNPQQDPRNSFVTGPNQIAQLDKWRLPSS